MIFLGLVAAIWFAALAKGAHDLWAATLLFAWISLLSVRFLKEYYQTKRHVRLPPLQYYGVVLIAFFLSSLYSFDVHTSCLELWIWFFSGVAFILFLNLFREPSMRIQFINAAGLVLLAVTLIAAVQYLQEMRAPTSMHWSAVSTFTNSSVLAGFTLSWTMMFWHFRRKAPVCRGLFVACMIALCLARSWWAFVSLSAGFLVYYKEAVRSAASARPVFMRNATILFLGLLIAGFYLKATLFQNRVADRWDWWMAGIRMVHDHPLTGIGLGAYGTAYPYFRPQTLLNTLYAHSVFVQLLSETGLLGTGSILLLAGAGCVVIRRQKQNSSEFMAYQASLVTILLFSSITIYMDYFIGKLMLSIMAALAMSAIPWKTHAITKRGLVGGLAGILLLIPGWYLPFRASQYYIEGLEHEERGRGDQAMLSFNKSIQLNGRQDESYAALAHLYKQAFLQRGYPSDHYQWHLYLEKAFHWKNDIRYYLELKRLSETPPTPIDSSSLK